VSAAVDVAWLRMLLGFKLAANQAPETWLVASTCGSDWALFLTSSRCAASRRPPHMQSKVDNTRIAVQAIVA
jgi:hypothetical protein